MERRNKVLWGLTLTGAVVVGCVSDKLTSPGGKTVSQMPAVSSRLVSGNLGFSTHGKSPYQCTVVAKWEDGHYHATNMWLRFPESAKAVGGATEVYAVEWRSAEGGSPAAAVRCRIPKTPDAEKILRERVLFIDPKTTRGGANLNASSASGRGLAPPTGAVDTRLTAPSGALFDLVTVVVIARTPSYMSGSGSGRSSPPEASVHPWWDQGYNYLAPGEPCDGQMGMGFTITDTFLKQDQEVLCPKTEFKSICADIWIPQCFVAGLVGDCRGPNGDADASLSRAQIVIPTNQYQGQSATYLNHTCAVFGYICLPPLKDRAYNDVMLIYTGDSQITVKGHLTNSLTSLGGVLPTPSIDFTFTLVKTNGVWSVPTGQRDAFPALGIWQWDPGTQSRTLLKLRDATIPEALTGIAPIFTQDKWTRCMYW